MSINSFISRDFNIVAEIVNFEFMNLLQLF